MTDGALRCGAYSLMITGEIVGMFSRSVDRLSRGSIQAFRKAETEAVKLAASIVVPIIFLSIKLSLGDWEKQFKTRKTVLLIEYNSTTIN